jgi:WD40 repeat protein
MTTKKPSGNLLVRLISLAVLLLLVTAAWFLAGYSPLIRIENQALSPLAFTPNGNVLAVGTLVPDGLMPKPVSPVRFINSVNGAEVETSLSTRDPQQPDTPVVHREIIRAEFSPDEKLLTILQEHPDIRSQDKLELVVFARTKREQLIKIPIPFARSAADHNRMLPTSFFSPDSKWMLWVEYPFPECSVRVWDLENGKVACTLPKVCNPIFSPDSKTLATIQYWRLPVKESFAVQLWDIPTGALRKTIPLKGVSEGWSPQPSFSPDGRLIAVGSRGAGGDQYVEVFEIETGDRVFQQESWSPQFLADGKTLVTVKDSDVQIWDTATWTLRLKSNFNLGKHWASGQDITPQPIAIPSKPLLMISDYYPAFTSPILRWIGKTFQLNEFGSHRVTLIDATSGRRQPVVFHDTSLTSKLVLSSDGSKMGLGDISGSIAILPIPARKSLTAVITALALGTVIILLTRLPKLLRRRNAWESKDGAANPVLERPADNA